MNNNKDGLGEVRSGVSDDTKFNAPMLVGFDPPAPEPKKEEKRSVPEPKKAEESGKNKKKKKRRGTVFGSIAKATVYLILVLGLSGLLGYYIIVLGNDIFGFVKSTELVEIEVPENATVADVVRIYADSGIVKYPKVFELYAKYKGYADRADEKGRVRPVILSDKVDENGDKYEVETEINFVAGTHQITPSMNYDSLLLALREKPDYGTVWITIPEGFTVDEVIDLFVENGIGTREGFVDAINNYPFDYDFVRYLDEHPNPDRFYRLEGYLFPDTYEFYLNSSEARVIYKLLSNFDIKYTSEFSERADELGMTTHEVIMLASIIEKETRYANEYELVSSVFHNRLKDPVNFPKLESDATIMYAIHHDTGERPTVLTSTDYESPYNTYKYPGFPPGPIANPGRAAIMCALYPEATNYYYFVATSSGTSIFSRTLAEHNAAVAKIRAGQS